MELINNTTKTLKETLNNEPFAQIGGMELEQGNSLNEQIAVDERKEKLIKEIEKLEKQARNEKLPNKKFELAAKVNNIKKELA